MLRTIVNNTIVKSDKSHSEKYQHVIWFLTKYVGIKPGNPLHFQNITALNKLVV